MRAHRLGRSRRVRHPVHTPSAARAGAHTQGRWLMAGSPGSTTASSAPLAARAVAGTRAHRWGRFVYRAVNRASTAHPAANARRAALTTRASDADGRTTNVVMAAAMAPVAMDAQAMRPYGPVAGAVGVVSAAV